MLGTALKPSAAHASLDSSGRTARLRAHSGGPANKVIIRNDRLGSDGEDHRSTHGADRRRRAYGASSAATSLGDLLGAEEADVEMTAADHRERIVMVEVRCTRQFGDWDLAGVDQIRIDSWQTS